MDEEFVFFSPYVPTVVPGWYEPEFNQEEELQATIDADDIVENNSFTAQSALSRIAEFYQKHYELLTLIRLALLIILFIKTFRKQ
jgi:hypothetical protein